MLFKKAVITALIAAQCSSAVYGRLNEPRRTKLPIELEELEWTDEPEGRTAPSEPMEAKTLDEPDIPSALPKAKSASLPHPGDGQEEEGIIGMAGQSHDLKKKTSTAPEPMEAKTLEQHDIPVVLPKAKSKSLPHPGEGETMWMARQSHDLKKNPVRIEEGGMNKDPLREFQVYEEVGPASRATPLDAKTHYSKPGESKVLKGGLDFDTNGLAQEEYDEAASDVPPPAKNNAKTHYSKTTAAKPKLAAGDTVSIESDPHPHPDTAEPARTTGAVKPKPKAKPHLVESARTTGSVKPKPKAKPHPVESARTTGAVKPKAKPHPIQTEKSSIIKPTEDDIPPRTVKHKPIPMVIPTEENPNPKKWRQQGMEPDFVKPKPKPVILPENPPNPRSTGGMAPDPYASHHGKPVKAKTLGKPVALAENHPDPRYVMAPDPLHENGRAKTVGKPAKAKTVGKPQPAPMEAIHTDPIAMEERAKNARPPHARALLEERLVTHKLRSGV